MNRLQEIEQRMAEINAELGAEAVLSEERLSALEAEVTSLREERTSILEAEQRRQALLNNIAVGNGNQTDPVSTAPTVLRNFPGQAGEVVEDDDVTSSVQYRKAFKEYVLRGTEMPIEYRADENTKTTDVSAAIPTTILNRIVEKMEKVGNILNLVTKTNYKGGLAIPKSSVNPTASWVAEGAGSDTQKVPLGNVTFAYHKVRCAVSVSLEVETTTLSAFETMLVDKITKAIIKALEIAIIKGDGSGKPKGITIETPVEDQEIDVTELSYKVMVDAEAAVPEEYEASAKWCMSKKTFMAFQGLVDADGQPIAKVNYGLAGKPERYLMGRQVELCQHVDTFSATLPVDTVFAFIFDFEDYTVNTNYQMTLKRYEDNETDDIVTKGIMLADGKVVDNSSLVILKKVTSV